MKEEKKYFPQLDAIRGISVLSVFIFHAYKPIFGVSIFEKFIAFILAHLGMGLDVFFILSAFLLTFLGIKEYEKTGKFSFRNYFIRRALRIWPLYYLLMFFSFIVLKIVQVYTGQQMTLPPPGWYLFFVSNFYLPDHVFFLRLLWTLSVEEQFYLLWGFCLLFFQKSLRLVILILSILSIGFIITQTIRGIGIYFHTLTYIVDMMAGAFAAFSITKKNRLFIYLNKISTMQQWFFYASFPLFCLFYFIISNSIFTNLGDLIAELLRLVFIIYCSGIIFLQMVNENKIINLSSCNFLIFTGKISYGLYCFHGFVISFGYFFLNKTNSNFSPLLLSFIFLFITYVIATISYKFIESPFLRLKEKLRKV